MFLVDTNVLIWGIAGHDPDAAVLRSVIEKNVLGLSVIVVAEFLVKARDNEKQALEALIANFPVLDISLSVAKLAAQFRAESLKRNRQTMMDCFLAAQAKFHNATLVTNNVADFPKKKIKVVSPDKLIKRWPMIL